MSHHANDQLSDDVLGPLLDPSGGLRRHAVRQSSVTVVGQLSQAGLQLAATFILARLLVPSDFGLIAMVATLVALVGLLRDIGLTQAIVQHPDLTRRQATGLFWVSVAASFLLAAVTALGAPLIARFYNEPNLVPITLAFAGIIFVTGLGATPQALLQRQMAFNRIVTGEVVAATLGVLVGVGIAALGGGYWALVAMPATRAIATTVFLWVVVPWRPGPPTFNRDIAPLLGFGSKVTGGNIANFLARNTDDVLVGRVWGVSALGQYAAAYRILLLPLTQLSAPLTRVAVPTLARVCDDGPRYRSIYIRLVGVLMTVASPIMAFAIIGSDWIVAVILGPGWGEAATILGWLALVGVVQPLTNSCGWLFLTQDRAGEYLNWAIVGSTIAVASFAIGLPFGAVGVAAAYAVSGVLLRTPILIYWVGRRGPVSSRDLYRTSVFPLTLSVLSVGSTAIVHLLLDGVHPLASILAAMGIFACGAAMLILFTSPGKGFRRDLAVVLSELRSRAESTDDGRAAEDWA